MSKFLETLVRSEGKSCAGKIKFPREDSAERSAAEMTAKRASLKEIFEHYKCAYCDGWHIGHRTNFDWIPANHKSYTLLLIQYLCGNCGVSYITNTVVSNRILQHFPTICIAKEHEVVCPKCKKYDQARETSRKMVCLFDVPEDSTESVQSLWDANPGVFETLDEETLVEENRRLRMAVRNQAGDNLCWLKDPELGKALPRGEFLQSCGRYYDQISVENGVVPPGCRTIAQLEARIVELEDQLNIEHVHPEGKRSL